MSDDIGGDDTDHYEPMRRVPRSEPVVIPRVPAVSTRAVWLIVLLPAFQFVAHATLVISSGGTTWLAIALGVALQAIGGVVLAERDRRHLAAEGLQHLPSPLFAMVPIVYLGLRSRTLYAQLFTGARPFWAHLVVLFAIGICFYALATFGSGLNQLGYL